MPQNTCRERLVALNPSRASRSGPTLVGPVLACSGGRDSGNEQPDLKEKGPEDEEAPDHRHDTGDSIHVGTGGRLRKRFGRNALDQVHRDRQSGRTRLRQFVQLAVADDTHVIISYNTVPPTLQVPDPVVLPGAMVIVLNHADTQVNTAKGLLVCTTANPGEPAPGTAMVTAGPCHNYDYPFYSFDLRANAENRIPHHFDER